MIIDSSRGSSISSMTSICREQMELNEWMWIALIAFYFGAEVWNGQLCPFTIPSETFPPNCDLRIQLKEGLPFLERTFNLKFKKNWIIQIIGGRGSPWCTTPALRHPNRQKRGNGRRVKRPLSRPHTHVWRVCVDSSLLRPLACPKHTLRHSDIRCTEMKWIDEQIRKKRNGRTRRWTNALFQTQLSDANPNNRWKICRLGVWLLARVDPWTKSVKCKRRKLLQQLMDMVPVIVTLMDASSEQLASRPSSTFQMREFTLP